MNWFEKACFVAGTPVDTADGLAPIESIELGTLVRSCNTATKTCEYRPVTALSHSRANELIDIATEDGGFITATPEHPFFVADKDIFVSARALQINTSLLTAAGGWARITSIHSYRVSPELDVYNLEVEEQHNYYVAGQCHWHEKMDESGRQTYLVHNCDIGHSLLKGPIAALMSALEPNTLGDGTLPADFKGYPTLEEIAAIELDEKDFDFFETEDGKRLQKVVLDLMPLPDYLLKRGIKWAVRNHVNKSPGPKAQEGGNPNSDYKPIGNMKEFFKANSFGKSIQKSSQKTSRQIHGQSVYKVTEKTENSYLKKGDQYYLDGLHKDHIEVFDKSGNFKHVLNLDGSYNKAKSLAGMGRKI